MENFKGTKGKWETSTLVMYTNDGQSAVLCGDKRICMVDVQNTKIKRKDLWNTPCEEREANAKLIAEAGNVANETGKTPRQLADINKKLLEALHNLMCLYEIECCKLDKSAYINAKNAINKATK